MSGRKEPTRIITEREYRRMLDAAKKAESAQRRASAEEQARKQTENDLRIAKKYNQDLENRINLIGNSLNKTIKDASIIKQQLVKTINNTNSAIKEQSEAFDVKLNNLGNRFADAMSENNRRIEAVINKNTAEIEREILALKDSNQKEINTLKADIKTLADKVGDPHALIDAGKDYLDVAIELIKQLKDSRHEIFCPGRMQSVVAAAEKAKKYIESALDNPASAGNAHYTGELAFDAAHNLFQDVAAAETLWKSKLSLALEALAAAQAEIDAHDTVVVNDENYGESKHDTDYWTKGALNELREQVKKLRDVLIDETKARELSFDDLDGITELAKDIFDDSENVRNGAVFAILNSQDRVEIANELAEDLIAKAGLTTVKAEGYEGDDMRAANLLHLKNGTTGFEVVITFKPTFKNGRCVYVAETDILNVGDNQADAAAFDDVLQDVMGKHGLSGNDPIPVNPKKQEEIKDWFEREAQTVATVTANPEINCGVNNIPGVTVN